MPALDSAWEVAATEPGARADLDALSWLPAQVPGTAAGALRDAGLLRAGEPSDFDAQDWWFRTRFEAAPGGPEVLCLDGIATVAEVFLNGERVLQSESMYAAHELDLEGRLERDNELAIRCCALAPLLAQRRRPRARWRSRVASDGNLRWIRTSLLGRAPGFAPGPAPVGPWRPVRLEHRSPAGELTVRARLEGDDGVLAVTLALHAPAAAELELTGPSGTHRTPLALDGPVARGELTVPGVARWWPHTHGTPVLHDVRVLLDGVAVERRRVGFRSLTPGGAADHDILVDGLDLHVNGVRIFARGAVWTPVDPIGLAPSRAELRTALEQVSGAGMNMLRVPGVGAYESPAFHDLCDELGILVWQDFMFANLDYPVCDGGFREQVESEARGVVAELAARPSLAVLCGNSEVEQQVAMLGLDPALGRGELFGELLPGLVRAAGCDAVYVPSAPCGGDRPFRPDRGVANYYGVGGYRRGLHDARLAGVRFASECLGFANVSDEAGADVDAGVPRDVGSPWDFADVRDHYLGLLFDVDPGELRRADPERYLALSRAVTGEVMAEVFGEWRRAGSPCGGGLVLWLRDVVPGSGWGVIDHRGRAKAALHHLRRVLAPVAVWTTDEGLAGVAVHVANDRPEPLIARLRMALYRDGELRVGEAEEELELAPHGALERNVEALLGRFVDAGYAYRFGAPQQDAIVVSLERERPGGRELLSQAVRFPAGRPIADEPAERLGLEAHARRRAEGSMDLVVRSRRLAYGVRVRVEGFSPADDAFSVEPGGERVVALHPEGGGARFAGGELTALNLRGSVTIAAPRRRAPQGLPTAVASRR